MFEYVPKSNASGGIDLDDQLIGLRQDASTEIITVPDAHLLFHGDFKRAGFDLKIIDDTGKSFLVRDYFNTDHLATLFSPQGAALTGDIVAALAGPLAPGQYAQATAPVSGATVIGRVATVQGNATAVRNGVAVTLNVGDAVYKGDVVQTAGDSAVGVVFLDGTTFNLSANARMVLNEFVYDPNGSANSAAISLVQGTISFLAGQVAKTGDMKVNTPVATMGIRGTAVNVTISADNGATQISVMAEADNLTHTVFVYAHPTQADIDSGKAVGALLGTVTNNGGVFTFNPTPIGVVVTETGKDTETVTKELTIIQQVFETKSVGQRFLQTSDNTKTAQTNTGTQFIVTERTSPTDTNSTKTDSGGPTVITVSTGQTTTTDTSNGTTGNNTSHVNHAPVALNDTNAVIAAGIPSAATTIATGNVLANDTDEDSGDTKTVTDVKVVSTHVHGTLTIAADGSYTYTLDNNSSLTKQLAAGETAQDIFTYTVSDRDGATSTAQLTITITGTNDDAVISVGATDHDSRSVVEDAHADQETASGTLSFADVDLTDHHSVSGVTASTGTLGTLTATVTADTTGTGSGGVINWNYTLPDSAVQYLAEGETKVETFTISLYDGSSTVTKTVAVTITGTNDNPTIETSSSTTTGTIESHQSGEVEAYSEATGDIFYSDPDYSDHHTVSWTYDADASDTGSQIGTFEATNTDDSTGGNEGKVSWEYSLSNDTLYSLAIGTYHEVFDVTVDDGHGGVTHETVTVTIDATANNSDPIVTGTTWEAADNGWSFDSANGHYYRYVSSSNATWDYANTTANADNSYLATITDDDENTFVHNLVGSHNAWLGGSDAGNEGTWTWRTGPESGDIFYHSNSFSFFSFSASSGGSSDYSNWNVGEPNNLNHGGSGPQSEDYLQMLSTGLWNDERGPDTTSANLTGGFVEERTAVGNGKIHFTDANTSDTHTADFTDEDDNSSYIGRFTVNSNANESNGTGTVGWHFTLTDSLPTNAVTQSYDVAIHDSHGATATQKISVSVGTDGADTFIFDSGVGADTIVNFNGNASDENHDTIDLESYHFSSYEDVSDHIHNDNGNAVIDLGHGDSVTITGMSADYLRDHLIDFVNIGTIGAS